MAALIKAPSRDKLTKMANGNREVVKAFEQLFARVNDLETRLAVAEATIAAEHP